MRKSFAALTLATIGAMIGATSAHAQERLAFPREPGFVMGFDKANATQSIQEWVPTGETVERWSRMLTHQRFTGTIQQGQTPAGLLEWISNQIKVACPGAQASAVTSASRFGRTGARMKSVCPLNKATGKPETTFYRAFAGARDMHVAQVAFRSVPDAAGEAWARAYLDKVLVCGTAQADAQPLCKAK